MWYWLSKDDYSWIPASESKSIEEEYQLHLSDKRGGQRVFHCFGNGQTACIDYNTMTTYCASARCMCSHERNDLPDDHMTFKLKRE